MSRPIDKQSDESTQELLDFMWQRRDKHLAPPSIAQMSDYMDFAWSTTRVHLEKLEEAGAIFYHRTEKGIRMSRNVELKRRSYKVES